MKKILIAALLFATSSFTYAQTASEIENDSQWVYGRAGTDADFDSDGQGDSSRRGSDKDLDNDGQWESNGAAPIEFSITTVSGIPTMVVQIGI